MKTLEKYIFTVKDLVRLIGLSESALCKRRKRGEYDPHDLVSISNFVVRNYTLTKKEKK